MRRLLKMTLFLMAGYALLFQHANGQEAVENPIRLSGLVFDVDSLYPLPGTHYFKISRGTGGITNEEGRFQTSVRVNDSIIFSFVGYKNHLLIISVCFGAAACSSDMTDLQEFVHKSKTEQRPKLPPLPEIKPHEVFRYSASHLRDPFEAAKVRAEQTVRATSKKSKGPKPIEGRPRELLESFPLDSLRMVGTLKQTSTMWALIRSNDGTIHRIKTGNYIGQNHGKIIDISEEQESEIVNKNPYQYF